MSSRRAHTLYENAQGRAQIGHAPHFNAVGKLLNREDIAPMLQDLLTLSALPLKSVETAFAQDSSGFRTTKFNEYCKHRYKSKREHRWVKAHILVGTKTNVVVGASITSEYKHDSPELKPLLLRAHENGFDIQELSADKAYSSRGNLMLVEQVGGTAYIPFRKNATDAPRGKGKRKEGTDLWKKMYHYFQLHNEEFMEHYHKRSNVETVFHMVKSKFGDGLKSKNRRAQENELLCKFIAHNICVLIQEMCEMGINPSF